MSIAIAFIIGVAVGVAAAVAIFAVVRGRSESRLRETFAALAAEALDANSQRLLQSAGAQLEGKKALIDQSLSAVADRVENVRQFIQKLEAERREDLGRLSGSVASLSQTAGELHRVLASSQRRGAWGERMAEDVLRLVGLQEKLNYLKQSSDDAEGGRADFTFLLPNDLKVNMDVKFPLDRYKAYIDADSDANRREQLQALCKAVRDHVRDVAGRGYVDPRSNTVPYVIVFIPSEAIYGLVLQSQPDLLDEAMKLKVVLCSPLTLYAMLAVMRQAAENYNVMKTADEVISLLGEFYKQWQKYNEELDKLGKNIETASKQFDVVRATRSNMLQKPLDRLEDLRQARGLPEQ